MNHDTALTTINERLFQRYPRSRPSPHRTSSGYFNRDGRIDRRWARRRRARGEGKGMARGAGCAIGATGRWKAAGMKGTGACAVGAG